MTDPPAPTGRMRRIAEELAEATGGAFERVSSPSLLSELDYALHPKVHERRVPSFGAIVGPATDPCGWKEAAGLHITCRLVGALSASDARLFADGLTTWSVPDGCECGELLTFDRPAGSERDLVILAEAMSATIVQRHPSGIVRMVNSLGVLRWDGMYWHHEPPVGAWIDELALIAGEADREVLGRLLAFAVHDLGARGIGALLLHRPDDVPAPAIEMRMPTPPPLRIDEPTDLAPLRHVLAQIDGAAVFDASGTLTHLGVRLVPTAEAEGTVDGYRGMRHTAARRYSYDDPSATVVAVSEDGPVTVLRGGEVLGRTRPT